MESVNNVPKLERFTLVHLVFKELLVQSAVKNNPVKKKRPAQYHVTYRGQTEASETPEQRSDKNTCGLWINVKVCYSLKTFITFFFFF